MSFLTLIQNACDRAGVTRPSAAYSSSDQQVKQLVGFAQQEGIELAQDFDWKILTKEKTFTGTAAAEQTDAIATDFDRFVPETFYNRTKKRPVFGPISAQDWQFTQAMVASTLVESFRVRGTDLLITPTPTTDTYAYEYIRNVWCQSSGGTAQSAWAADTDTGILPEEIMTLGVVWRYRKSKGLDYAEDFRSYELAKARAQSKDGGRRRLNMASKSMIGRARAPFIQEGSWSL